MNLTVVTEEWRGSTAAFSVLHILFSVSLGLFKSPVQLKQRPAVESSTIWTQVSFWHCSLILYFSRRFQNACTQKMSFSFLKWCILSTQPAPRTSRTPRTPRTSRTSSPWVELCWQSDLRWINSHYFEFIREKDKLVIASGSLSSVHREISAARQVLVINQCVIS